MPIMPDDNILEKRGFQNARPDFADRIIAAALRHPQQKAVSIGTWLSRLCVEFQLPKPAFAFSFIFAIGVMAGFIAPVNGIPEEQDTPTMQDFLYEDETML